MASTWSTKELQTTYIILNLNVISHVIVYLIHPEIFYKYRISCIVSTSCRLHYVILNLNVYFTWAYLNMQRCYCYWEPLFYVPILYSVHFSHIIDSFCIHIPLFSIPVVCSRSLIGDFILSYLLKCVWKSRE